jgi:hypothetical protein
LPGELGALASARQPRSLTLGSDTLGLDHGHKRRRLEQHRVHLRRRLQVPPVDVREGEKGERRTGLQLHCAPCRCSTVAENDAACCGQHAAKLPQQLAEEIRVQKMPPTEFTTSVAEGMCALPRKQSHF